MNASATFSSFKRCYGDLILLIFLAFVVCAFTSFAVWFERSSRIALIEKSCASAGMKWYATGVLTPDLCLASDGTLRPPPPHS